MRLTEMDGTAVAAPSKKDVVDAAFNISVMKGITYVWFNGMKLRDFPEHMETVEAHKSKLIRKLLSMMVGENFVQGRELLAKLVAVGIDWPELDMIRNGYSAASNELDEVRMGPGALARFASTPFAQSMTVGFEAEMVVDGLQPDPEDIDYADLEPDMDYDRDFPTDRGWRKEVLDFFTDGEWSDNPRAIQAAIDALEQEYIEWMDVEFDDYTYGTEGRKALRKAVAAELDTITLWSEAVANYDPDLVDDSRRLRREYETYRDDGTLDDHPVLKTIADYYHDILVQEVNDSMAERGTAYENAYERLRYEHMNKSEFSSFTSEYNINTMWDFSRKYNLSWPYQLMRDADTSVNELADNFSKTLGVKARVSTSRYGLAREPDTWIFEPDTSIKPGEGQGGIELISPPMPLPRAMEAIDDFFDWAEKNGAGANESTGFHVGVSLPSQSTRDIDRLKLLLFLGDEYVLSVFERKANSYAKSLLAGVRSDLTGWGALSSMETMRKGFTLLAGRELSDLAVTHDRYVSVNFKNNYVEFRSAGGNYFNKKDAIKNTVLRYVRAMAIAADPEAEKKEYGTKLYKLFSGIIKRDDDTVKYFAKYAAGEIPMAALKSFVRNIQDKRREKRRENRPRV